MLSYIRIATLIAGVMISSRMTFAQVLTYPPTQTLGQVRAWIKQHTGPHPRLFANADQLAQLKQKADATPLGQATARGIVRQAELLLDTPPITRKLQGRRLLGESRKCVKRVLTLAMAFHLTGDSKFAARAEKEMLAVAAFEDWNPSHFLDVGEMTFALALGYDWLYDALGPASRKTIRTAIVDKGVTLPFTTQHKGWVRATNNWGQVCHGGLTAGALAVLEDEPELAAKTVHNALHNVTRAMAAFAPKGSYPEGPGYWVYGTSYNVLLIAALESALATDFGLSQAPGFNVTGQFPALACGPSGEYFNFSDGGAGRSFDPTLFWLASRFDHPDWLLGEPERLAQTIAQIDRRDGASAGSRLLPLVLLWMKGDMKIAEIHMPLHWSSEGSVPITIHRSSWTDPKATFVGLKGGAPSANHGQMDIGSFVLDADGVRWAMDLGSEGYNGIESRGMNLWDRSQDSDRWTIFRQSNSGHNTLVIDGQLQQAAGAGRFIKFSDQQPFPHSVLDMSDVYEGQATSVLRGVALLPSGEVLIQDELSGLSTGAAVRWGMITPAKAGEIGNSAILLQQKSATLTLQILAPEGAAWEEVNTATPPNKWDSPNRGTRMVAFRQTAPASRKLTYAVLITPGSCTASVLDQIQLRPLRSW